MVALVAGNVGRWFARKREFGDSLLRVENGQSLLRSSDIVTAIFRNFNSGAENSES
jgi:hypothetical protein